MYNKIFNVNNTCFWELSCIFVYQTQIPHAKLVCELSQTRKPPAMYYKTHNYATNVPFFNHVTNMTSWCALSRQLMLEKQKQQHISAKFQKQDCNLVNFCLRETTNIKEMLREWSYVALRLVFKEPSIHFIQWIPFFQKPIHSNPLKWPNALNYR